MPDGQQTVDLEEVKAKLRQHADNAGRVVPKAPSGLIDAASLQDQEFPPIKYVIPGYVPEGLTILAGKPKLGKSWLSLDWAAAVAYGGTAMESIRCDQGDVLYAALEDNPRRLQRRMQTLLPNPHMRWPARLQFATDMPRLDNGGVEQIEAWIDAAQDARLVIVDTLAKVRGSRGRNDTHYEQDYAAVEQLQRLAGRRKIAIVLVTHTTKMSWDDPIDSVSGTLGLTGAADTTLVLNRKSDGNVTLYGRGRDTEEIEQAIQFGKESCRWSILGDAGKVQRSGQRQAILDVLAEAPEPLGPADIAAATDTTSGSVRKLLVHMLKDGDVEKVGYGRYRIPDHGSGNTGNTGNTSPESPENCGVQSGESVTGGEAGGNTSADAPEESVTDADRAVTPEQGQKPPETADQRESVTSVTGVTGVNAGNTVTETVDVRLYGGSGKYAKGRTAYRVGREQAPTLEARGWTSVHHTRGYVYLQPPKGVHVRKNKAPVTITRPSDDDLDRLAQAVHAAGVPDQGEVAGWPWSYTPPSRTESRYETVQTTDGSRRQWRPSVEKCGVFWVGAVSGVWTWCKRFDQEVDHDA